MTRCRRRASSSAVMRGGGWRRRRGRRRRGRDAAHPPTPALLGSRRCALLSWPPRPRRGAGKERRAPGAVLVTKPGVPEPGVGGVPGVVEEVVWAEAAAALDLLVACTAARRDRRDRDPVGGQMPVIGEMGVAPGERRPHLPITAAHRRADVMSVACAGGRGRDGERGGRGGPAWWRWRRRLLLLHRAEAASRRGASLAVVPAFAAVVPEAHGWGRPAGEV